MLTLPIETELITPKNFILYLKFNCKTLSDLSMISIYFSTYRIGVPLYPSFVTLLNWKLYSSLNYFIVQFIASITLLSHSKS